MHFPFVLKVSHREEALQRLQVQQKDFVEEVNINHYVLVIVLSFTGCH